MKVKICGLKQDENIGEILKLKPNFIGFIFYPKSPRFVDYKTLSFLKDLKNKVKKVGVFVNEKIETVNKIVETLNLDYVQLHGNETPKYCQEIENCKIIKAFGVSENFDFSETEKYLKIADFFIFDTKTKSYGGSGKTFNWQVLKKYNFDKKFLLSGGIDIDTSNELRQFKHNQMFGVDINSKFEISPGLKNVEKISQFLKSEWKVES